MNMIDELKTRELLYAVTDESIKELLEKEKITFYLGADPTGDSLHIGHLVTYLVARRLAKKGHQAILVIGGGTGLIGDPSGKSEERQLLTLEETLYNSEKIASQVQKILPNAIIVNNYDWLKTYDIVSFLRDIGKHFSINTMLAKDSVKSRLETGISFTEFSYQVIQALDFLHLYKTYGCTLQIGGQDQWGNITAGLDLIRRVEGSNAKAYGFVIPLITKPDGTKFGKTAGQAIWLDASKTSPYAFYQYWINLPDDEAIIRLKQFTDLSFEEIKTIEQKMIETPHYRYAQKTLAEHLTNLCHGLDALEQAKRITQALFDNQIDKLTPLEIEMGFEGLPSIISKEPILLVDALIELNLASSKRDSKTLINNQAVTINGIKVTDDTYLVTSESALYKQYNIIRKGKKQYGIINHK